MNSSVGVPYWVVASRAGCVLPQVIAPSRELPFEVAFYTSKRVLNQHTQRVTG